MASLMQKTGHFDMASGYKTALSLAAEKVRRYLERLSPAPAPLQVGVLTLPYIDHRPHIQICVSAPTFMDGEAV